jgi:hypothetical protein
MRTAALGVVLCLQACASATDSGAAATNSGTSTGSTAWVYYNGVFNWQGDFSAGLTPNYAATTGDPIEGPYDIANTVTTAYGLWLPYFNALCDDASAATEALCFDTAPYNYMIFSLQPTVANQTFQLTFASFVSDEQDGNFVTNVVSYCTPAPTPEVWSSCKIPLSAFSLTQPLIRKFNLQDETGLPTNLYYLDNVGFTAN